MIIITIRHVWDNQRSVICRFTTILRVNENYRKEEPHSQIYTIAVNTSLYISSFEKNAYQMKCFDYNQELSMKTRTHTLKRPSKIMCLKLSNDEKKKIKNPCGCCRGKTIIFIQKKNRVSGFYICLLNATATTTAAIEFLFLFSKIILKNLVSNCDHWSNLVRFNFEFFSFIMKFWSFNTNYCSFLLSFVLSAAILIVFGVREIAKIPKSKLVSGFGWRLNCQ